MEVKVVTLLIIFIFALFIQYTIPTTTTTAAAAAAATATLFCDAKKLWGIYCLYLYRACYYWSISSGGGMCQFHTGFRKRVVLRIEVTV